ncbi:MAG: amino acid permease [Paludibacteraceae bacterium]
MNGEKKLSLWLLVFIGIGSMVGSGIFNSPKDLIAVANPQGAMITWLIGGVGALMLALVFVYLNHRRPELQSGIFDYAKAGFGEYMGFNSAWGYWSMGWLGNISYLLLFFKTLNDMLGEHALLPLSVFLSVRQSIGFISW